ncbi:hypothetical protein FNV43_RR23061 [Rhamnella rubrinervis]|uniref:Uncharacterized protein n=1 Tax=Rhamnella rubrinervis TaxID=2594499 RepID=A0A8K0GRQ1_9ROSA|nr:hypothetical protein FNV43_RR23061 [Rhamnella rubrinervis]
MEDVKPDLHKISVEVISRGGMEQVRRKGRLKEVCNAANIRQSRQLFHKYYEFLPDKDELQYCNDQAIQSFCSDPQPRVVGSENKPLQVKVKPRITLQDIPEFLYSDKRHSNRGRIQDIEKLKEKEGESKDEVDVNSYEGFEPGRKFSYVNCELKGKHVEVHEWGRDLTLAVGDSSSKVLPESEQIEDKDLNPSK